MSMEKNNSIGKKVMIVSIVMVLSIMLLSQYLITNPEYVLINTVTTDNSGGIDNSIGLNVIVEHYRDSKLLSKQEKENDIFLANFGSYLAASFKGGDLTTFNVNTEATGLVRGFTWIDYSYVSQSIMRIGTGTTAPALTDWSLETEVYYDEMMQVAYTVAGSQMNVTYATSFGIDASHTLAEVGFSYQLDCGTTYNILMARDLLPSPIGVIAGDIVTVKYVIMFN